MFNRIRHLLVYAVIATIVGTVWTLGWAREQNDASDLGYYPPAEPELFRRAMEEGENSDRPEQKQPACTQPAVTSLDWN